MDYTCHKSLMKSEKKYLSVVTNSDILQLCQATEVVANIGNVIAMVHSVQGLIGLDKAAEMFGNISEHEIDIDLVPKKKCSKI